MKTYSLTYNPIIDMINIFITKKDEKGNVKQEVYSLNEETLKHIEYMVKMLNFLKEKKVDFGWLLHCNQCHPGKIVAIKDHYNLGCNSNNNERLNEDEIKYLLDWLL